MKGNYIVLHLVKQRRFRDEKFGYFLVGIIHVKILEIS